MPQKATHIIQHTKDDVILDCAGLKLARVKQHYKAATCARTKAHADEPHFFLLILFYSDRTLIFKRTLRVTL